MLGGVRDRAEGRRDWLNADELGVRLGEFDDDFGNVRGRHCVVVRFEDGMFTFVRSHSVKKYERCIAFGL